MANAYMAFPYTSIDYLWIDTAEAVYTTKLIALGRIPYKEIFSHHFLGYLAPLFVLEKIYGVTPQAVWLLAIVFNFVNSVLIFCILKRLSCRSTAYWGALFTATAGWFPSWQGLVFNVQSAILPLIYGLFWGYLILCERRTMFGIFAFGFLFGWLAITDIRHIAFALVFLPLFIRYPVKLLKADFIYFLLGASLLPGFALTYLWSHDALNHFVFQGFSFPLLYRNFGLSDPHSDYLSFLVGGFSHHPNEVALAFVGTIVACLLPWSREVKFSLLSLAISGIIASAIAGRAFANYLLYFVPWISIAAPLTMHMGLRSGTFVRIGRVLLPLVCFLNIALGPLYTQVIAKSLRVPIELHALAKKAAAFVRGKTHPNSNILVWSYYPQIYLFAERFSRWRVMEQLPITGANFKSRRFSEQGIVPELVHEFRSCLFEYPPAFILYFESRKRSFAAGCAIVGGSHVNGQFERRHHLKYLRNFIRDHYRLSRTYSSSCNRIRLYALSPSSHLRPRRNHQKFTCEPKKPQPAKQRFLNSRKAIIAESILEKFY